MEFSKRIKLVSGTAAVVVALGASAAIASDDEPKPADINLNDSQGISQNHTPPVFDLVTLQVDDLDSVPSALDTADEQQSIDTDDSDDSVDSDDSEDSVDTDDSDDSVDSDDSEDSVDSDDSVDTGDSSD